MKKHGGVGASPQSFFVRPAPGWLDVTESEIRSIFASPLHRYKFEPTVERLKGVVKVHRCDWRQGLEMTLRLTSAHDVEWLLVDAACSNWDRVHKVLAQVPWDSILPVERPSAHVTGKASGGFTSSSANLREAVVKAAGLQLSEEEGRFRFKIDLREKRLQLTLSLCGDPLYKRGYKANLVASAPLPEHHAAACVRWTLGAVDESQPPVTNVYVPFAGSGTLGFEAMLSLAGGGPGSFPRRFTCDDFPATSAATMDFVRRRLAERLASASHPRVFFQDTNADAIASLKANISSFGHGDCFKVTKGDVFKTPPPVFGGDGRILILLNPPFGHRLAKASDVTAMYRQLGSFMKDCSERYPNRIAGCCLCPDEDCWRIFTRDLRDMNVTTHHFTHGGEDIRLVRWSNWA